MREKPAKLGDNPLFTYAPSYSSFSIEIYIFFFRFFSSGKKKILNHGSELTAQCHLNAYDMMNARLSDKNISRVMDIVKRRVRYRIR